MDREDPFHPRRSAAVGIGISTSSYGEWVHAIGTGKVRTPFLQKKIEFARGKAPDNGVPLRNRQPACRKGRSKFEESLNPEHMTPETRVTVLRTEVGAFRHCEGVYEASREICLRARSDGTIGFSGRIGFAGQSGQFWGRWLGK